MKKIIQDAIKAMENSYAPYSKFHVGAAILLKNGHIITGSNVENAAYGSTMCAERSAMFAAYSQGFRKNDIEEFAVAGKTKEPIAPCGACRQVMAELINQKTPVHLIGENACVKTTSIQELLPYEFEDLK